MKKRKETLALLFVLCLALSACGASGMSSVIGDKAEGEPPQQSTAYESNEGGGPSADADNIGFLPEEAAGSAGGAYYENTKVIRTAELTLQATDFEGAVEELNRLVDAQGGYYESSECSNGSYSGGTSRRGSFTVRLPKENFDAFLGAVGDIAHVSSQVTGVQDVGEGYYDAELHLETLKTKHERLLELLEKAELMEDILTLESALSDVEYQIQQYSSTLTRYDALIDFSTIHVELREVVRVTENPTQADPLHVRLGAAFSEGWSSFCEGMADLAIWCAYNFMGLLVLILIIVLAVFLCRRLARRGRVRVGAAYTPPAPPAGVKKEDKEQKGR